MGLAGRNCAILGNRCGVGPFTQLGTDITGNTTAASGGAETTNVSIRNPKGPPGGRSEEQLVAIMLRC